MLETKEVHFIYASTGCTCCSSENFYEGPYDDKAKAQAIADEWSAGHNNPLCSQYSKTGNYKVITRNAEIIPDGSGRFIIDDTVLNGFGRYSGDLYL
jgi:hypothetical protein